MKYLRELERSQWWPRDRILELQNQRLRLLVKYAYENVPYYRRIFDERGLRPADIQNSNDLVKLPILTRAVIRSNFNQIAAPGFSTQRRVLLATGGSTGQPLVFYTTKRDHKDLCIASLQRARSAIGFELGDKSASIRTKYPYESTSERFWQAPVRFFQRNLFIDFRQMSSNSVRTLEAFQPRFIIGYPSSLEQLARITQIKGKSRIRPRAIITDSEQLYDYQRNLFREVFGCDTYDVYAAREEHLIAFECKEHLGYHIAAENVIVEVVNAEGEPEPVAAGKRAEC